MGMGDDDGFKPLFLLFDELQIRQHHFDARQFRPRKGNAAIHQNPAPVLFAAKAVKAGIHANFANAAKRHKDQLIAASLHLSHYPFCGRICSTKSSG